MTDTNLRDEVSALARGIALLRAVAEAGQPLGNKDLADVSGIPKATVSRLTATLLSAGLLRQADDSERFSLGPMALTLGNAYLATFDFRQQARLHLAELADACGAHVHLGVRDGLDVLLIDSLKPKAALILSRLDIGSRMAIATSASGRAYLSALAPEPQAALLGDLRKASGKGWSALETRLKSARQDYARQGFCTSFGEWHPDIHALGFALRGPQGERYAVSVGGPAYKLSKAFLLDKVAPRLLQVKAAIGREVGVGLGARIEPVAGIG